MRPLFALGALAALGAVAVALRPNKPTSPAEYARQRAAWEDEQARILATNFLAQNPGWAP